MSKPIEWVGADIVRRKMPYEPYTKTPFGITTWAKAGNARVRIYQNSSGEIIWVEIA